MAWNVVEWIHHAFEFAFMVLAFMGMLTVSRLEGVERVERRVLVNQFLLLALMFSVSTPA